MNEADLKAYRQVLDDYQCELISVAQLSAHLLDLCIDAGPEWRSAGCYLMRNRLIELAEGLPFPSTSQAGASPAPTEGRADVALAHSLGLQLSVRDDGAIDGA